VGTNTEGNKRIQTTLKNSSSPSSSSNQSSTFIFVILFVSIVRTIDLKLHNRGKSKERKSFPQHIEENILRK
jgi:hypothetical protein